MTGVVIGGGVALAVILSVVAVVLIYNDVTDAMRGGGD